MSLFDDIKLDENDIKFLRENEGFDLELFFCPTCDEEYHFQEDVEECPICGDQNIEILT